jgi:hypothetical protein
MREKSSYSDDGVDADVPENVQLPVASNPKVRTADALAREHSAAAILTLVEVMESGDKDNARVAAAKEILDRGWGKPLTATISLPATRRLASTLYAMEEDELLTVIAAPPEPSFATGSVEAELEDTDAALAALPSVFDAPSIDDDPLLS